MDMSKVVDLVARNCGLSKSEAKKEIESFREDVLNGTLNPFDDIESYLGIEPDYLMDILCF